MRSGHVLVGADGQFLSIDRGFSDIMRTTPEMLIGRPVLDVTAPADRHECFTAITRLRATRQPFEISKRFVRDDGSLVWVTNTVSMVDHGRDENLLVATITPMAIENCGARAPALLLDCAQMMTDLREDRAAIFDASLFSDTGWDVILRAYIAEAEGRAITVSGLAAKLGLSQARAERWVNVLIGQGVIEIETRSNDPCAPKSFRLTGATHARLEDHLARAGALRNPLWSRAAAH
jgi:PAS domain S-box-containing protein